MRSKAEQAALRAYPPKRKEVSMSGAIYTVVGGDFERRIFKEGYEQAEKDTIERAVAWLEETFFDNSHHSGRGSYGQIETNDFDSMEEMIEQFKKAMKEE